MVNEINPKFIQFIKYLMKEGDVSTSKLSLVLNKSRSYTHRILNGVIKTISFSTALNILTFLNEKHPFAQDEESIVNMLVYQFHIEPEEWIQKRIEDAEAEEERRQELITKINSCLITNYNTFHLENILEFCNLGEKYDHQLFDMIFTALKNDNRTLKLLIHSLHSDEWGSLIQVNEKEEKIVNKIKEIIKELNIIE